MDGWIEGGREGGRREGMRSGRWREVDGGRRASERFLRHPRPSLARARTYRRTHVRTRTRTSALASALASAAAAYGCCDISRLCKVVWVCGCAGVRACVRACVHANALPLAF